MKESQPLPVRPRLMVALAFRLFSVTALPLEHEEPALLETW
jgi:hypothetical protein